MKYTVFDLETTMRAPDPHFSASPHWPGNEVVMAGGLDQDGNLTIEDYPDAAALSSILDTDLIVGHNVKFDLLYGARVIHRRPIDLAHGRLPLRPDSGGRGPVVSDRKIRLWDTSIVEYILRNHRMRMPSLDVVAKQRGTPTKDATVSDLIKSGMCPSKIDRDMLAHYLEGDLVATREIFLQQYKEVYDRKLDKVVWATMEALWATTEMQHNGMAVDLSVLRLHEQSWDARLAAIDTELSSLCKLVDVFATDPEFSWGSNHDLSRLLFGGTKNGVVKESVGYYKNGRPKFKNVTKLRIFTGLGLTPKSGSETSRAGIFSVDDKSLSAHSGKSKVVDLLLERRALAKLGSTYGNAIRTKSIANVLYGQLHHNVTGTGRLSSSDPNLQNMPNHEFKRCFVSRFGATGRLVEVDFDQLEMVGLAVISGCPVLTDDLKHGRDMHVELYKSMYGRVPTKSERKAFKPLSFGLVYGAGAKTLCENSGMPLTEVKRFIKVFYDRYVGVKAWHDSQLSDSLAGREPSALRDTFGVPLGKFSYTLPTGRCYDFYEYRNERGDYSFSPPELKNWPVQGFATADVVPFLVGRLFRTLFSCFGNDHKILLINTIHDSILFDCKDDDAVEELRRFCIEFFGHARKLVEVYYGVNQPLEYHVGIESGPNWYDKKEIYKHA